MGQQARKWSDVALQYFCNIPFAIGSLGHILSFTWVMTKNCVAVAEEIDEARNGNGRSVHMLQGARIGLTLWAVLVSGAAWAEIWSATRTHEAVRKGDLILLDIRTPKEWEQTGVPEGAWPIDMYSPTFPRALQAVFRANPGKRIGMICAVGGRTGYVEQVLKRNGFPEIVNVGEGMHGSKDGKGWLRHGLPVVSPDKALGAMPKDYSVD